MSSLREVGWARKITEAHVWAFTPFAMLLISAIIILVRTISPPDPSKPVETVRTTLPPALPKPAEIAPTAQVPGVTVPADLGQLSNQDIRTLCYVISRRVDELADLYIQRLIKINSNSTMTSEQKAEDTSRLDAELNRGFRLRFVSDI